MFVVLNALRPIEEIQLFLALAMLITTKIAYERAEPVSDTDLL